MSFVQSVLLDRRYFTTPTQARSELRRLGFSDNGVDVTARYWRFRQFNPPLRIRRGDRSIRLRTKQIAPGIKFIFEFQ